MVVQPHLQYQRKFVHFTRTNLLNIDEWLMVGPQPAIVQLFANPYYLPNHPIHLNFFSNIAKIGFELW